MNTTITIGKSPTKVNTFIFESPLFDTFDVNFMVYKFLIEWNKKENTQKFYHFLKTLEKSIGETIRVDQGFRSYSGTLVRIRWEVEPTLAIFFDLEMEV